MIAQKIIQPTAARPARVPAQPVAARGFFEITSATIGSDLQSLTRQHGADFVIIGMLVPAREGLALCDTLRKRGASDSTVLMLRNMGAPPPPEQPGFARNAPEEDGPIVAGEIAIIPGRHEVKVRDTEVELTRTELRLLAAMARRPGWVFTRENLIRTLHGENGHCCTERTIDVHVTSLRRKLGGAARCVETVRGVGYRFAE